MAAQFALDHDPRAFPDQIGSALSLRGARKGDEAIQKTKFSALDCFAEPVIGTRDFARSRWLVMTIQFDQDGALEGTSEIMRLIIARSLVGR
jgi:hypothetical protein